MQASKKQTKVEAAATRTRVRMSKAAAYNAKKRSEQSPTKVWLVRAN